MKIWKIIVTVIIVFPILMYFINPFNTATLDPRARVFGVIPYRIPSESMSTTLQVGDFILVNATTYSSEKPKRNDVIVFKFPKDRSVDFVMRVVALGGEEVSVQKGKVFVNHEAINQPYVDEEKLIRTRNTTSGPWLVPENMLFVLGDNRDNSNDSRYWGFVPIEDVVGKVSMIWMSKNTERIGMGVE